MADKVAILHALSIQLPSGFNNSGQLAIRTIFTDGTEGILISNLVAIPRPGSLLLAALAAAGLLLPRLARESLAGKGTLIVAY